MKERELEGGWRAQVGKLIIVASRHAFIDEIKDTINYIKVKIVNRFYFLYSFDWIAIAMILVAFCNLLNRLVLYADSLVRGCIEEYLQIQLNTHTIYLKNIQFKKLKM